ncbi:MAG: rhodanese-related sulfurtransferase [Candidatus Gracilibacteria bacterium]|jgi:UPF0176 protein
MFTLKNKLDKATCLKNLAAEPFKRITLSFYRYTKIQHPRDFRDQLYREWSELGVFGRIYLAREGINAQMSVPEPQFEAFKANLESHAAFKAMPLKIGVEQGESFYKLTIKVKNQIVADGLPEDSYDLSQVGNHLTAEEFNKALEDANTVVVDMRNFYESKIGHFEGAVCPDSNTFKEELPMALEALKGKEDQKVLLYCTGGIRCEKASAYLKHQGFKDVNQLHGGIIAYKHEIEQKGLPSKFKGSNYVFDERISERITPDVLSECDQCDVRCDRYVNCANAACNLLFLQCEACRERMHGACTPECKGVADLPEEERKAYYAAQEKCTYAVYVSRIRPNLK